MAKERAGAGNGNAGNAGRQAAQAVGDVTETASAGLRKLRGDWADFAGDLLGPVMVLASGGTKAQAIWSGFQNVFVTRVLGPLGMVVGAATGFLLVSKKLVAEWKEMGVRSAKAIETLTLQFKPLLGSMELAKQRAREVFAFSVKSPFKFGDLAEGNKILESLTRGALATKDGMELVGDAAAVAGADFSDTARQVGRLYDGLMSGRPVGEAAFRLQELGLISGQTRTQIEAMQEANAAGSAVWEVARKDLERTKGAMETLSQSLEGLESTYEDTRTQLEAGFGQGFMEGEKASIKSATAVMEAMTPVAEYLGRNIGQLDEWWQRLKARVVESLTGFAGFKDVVSGAAVAMTGFAAAVVLAVGGKLGEFALGIRNIAAGQKALAAATAAASGMETVAAFVTSKLTAAKNELILALRAITAGNALAAGSHLRTAVAEAVAAARTNGLAAAQVVLRGALRLTWMAARMVAASLWQVAVAMVATPAGQLALLLVAAGGAMLHFYTAAKKAREEMEAYAASAKAVVDSLRLQAEEIRTVADLRKAEADAVLKLADAYAELYAANEAGDGRRMSIARKKVEEVKGLLNAIRGKRGKTELSAEEIDREDARKARGKEATRAAGEDEAARGETSALEVARRRKAEGDAKEAEARKAEAAEKKIQQQQDAARSALADSSVEEGALKARRKKLAHELTLRGMAPADTVAGREKALMLDELKIVREKLDLIQKTRAAREAEISGLALSGDSELARLNEQLGIYEELAAARKRVLEAEAAEGQKSDKTKTDEIVAEMEQKAKDTRDAREALKKTEIRAGRAGVGSWGRIDQQNHQRRVKEIKDTRDEDLDPVAKAERERAVRDAELALAQGRVDAEAKIADLRLKGYEQENAALNAEEEKLRLAEEQLRNRKEMTAAAEADFAQQRGILSERRSALEREAGMRREEMDTALQLAMLKRRSEAARERGSQEESKRLKEQADKIEEIRARRDAENESNALPEGQRGDYVDRRMEEWRQAREEENARQEKERQRAMDETGAGRNTAAAEIRARMEEIKGNGESAKKIREEAARVQDKVDRARKADEYRKMGYTDKQADSMATKDVKQAQLGRMMDELMPGGGNTLVAGALTEVGGGGNVYGGNQERSVKLLERIAKAVEDANDPSKVDIGW